MHRPANGQHRDPPGGRPMTGADRTTPTDPGRAIRVRVPGEPPAFTPGAVRVLMRIITAHTRTGPQPDVNGETNEERTTTDDTCR
jgi:hypothetical protein